MLRNKVNSIFWIEVYDDFDGLGKVVIVIYLG